MYVFITSYHFPLRIGFWVAFSSSLAARLRWFSSLVGAYRSLKNLFLVSCLRCFDFYSSNSLDFSVSWESYWAAVGSLSSSSWAYSWFLAMPLSHLVFLLPKMCFCLGFSSGLGALYSPRCWPLSLLPNSRLRSLTHCLCSSEAKWSFWMKSFFSNFLPSYFFRSFSAMIASWNPGSSSVTKWFLPKCHLQTEHL